MNDTTNLSMGEAASRFLTNLSPDERGASQQEIYKFLRWFGWDHSFSRLAAPDVDRYAQQLSLSDTDYARKLEMVKAFLAYVKKQGWSKTNLSIHLKAKKAKTPTPTPSRRGTSEPVSLTQQGYADIEADLAALKEKRAQAIDDMRRAAADKDFRENAPLEAAREQHGQLEGRIRELEEALKSASIAEEKQQTTLKVSLGDQVTLCDLASGEELRYTLVNPREVDPSRGKISTVSPIGKAIIGRGQEEVVEVTTPAGKLRYQIKQVER